MTYRYTKIYSPFNSHFIDKNTRDFAAPVTDGAFTSRGMLNGTKAILSTLRSPVRSDRISAIAKINTTSISVVASITSQKSAFYTAMVSDLKICW